MIASSTSRTVEASRASRNAAKKAATFVLALLVSCPPAQSQQARSYHADSSDLASENLKRVAASAAQLEEVLRGEPGLLVELKRWVAKEATDRGQIVEDAELTDQGIFDRLARDLQFRAVATRLLQRYGYLLPKLNPQSETAKEQDLLLKEKTRLRARAEVAEEEALERASTCDPRRDPECVEEGRHERTKPPGYADRGRSETRPSEEREGSIPSPVPANPLEERQPHSRPFIQTSLEPAMEPTPRRGERPEEALASPSDTELGAAESRIARGTEAEELEPASRLRRERTAETRLRPAPRGAEGKKPEELESLVMVRRANPYADIPSLYDMYVQASVRRPAIEHFGLEVFRNGTRDSELIPMDLPVGPDYVVGPGDGVAIDLWGSVSRRLYRTVDREGRLALPEAGPVLVSGRTLGEVQSAVQQVLRTQFRDVSADVSLSRLRTIRVYVVGDVAQPGAYDISSLSTPLNALFAAGGPTARGSLRALKHLRGNQVIEEVDAYDLLLRGVRSDLKRLETGDTLLVSPIGPQVMVEGMVRRPSIYELRGEKTLAEVLELAGGILPTAALRHIEVQRVEAHQKRTMLSLDASGAEDTEAVAQQLESFRIQDGDEIHIFPIAPYSQDAVYLQGYVLRPGKYSFHAGMKLTDLVSSHADLLPEPATQYAEIIRLNPPDHRPSVESFDLAAALATPAAAPKLQPLDTVRIFSRYDFEAAPSVNVGGEVRKPGHYRTSGETHLRDAIYLAGGVTPDALLETAQLVRTVPDGKLKIMSINLAQALAGNPLDNILLERRDLILVHRVPAKVDPASVYVKGEAAKPGRYPLTTNLRVEDLIRLAGGLKRSAYPASADLTRYSPGSPQGQIGEHREINIAAALAGDPEHNLLLRDGDVLTIRQLPGWNDIGASISVQGEVEHAGVYGIRPGERLSSVLKRAGGFRPTAYSQAAVFERVEVRRLQEKSRQELIQRIEQEVSVMKVSLSEGAKEQAELQQAAMRQREQVLEALRKAPITGRLVIHLTSDLAAFENSPDDIEVRAGDAVYVPKRPEFVVVTGQVYNSNAITYEPHKTVTWYLKQAGGPTSLAERKAIFVVHANGSVVTGKEQRWWGAGILSTRIEPGDTIIVPERAIGASSFWKNLLPIAQLVQGSAIAAVVVTK